MSEVLERRATRSPVEFRAATTDGAMPGCRGYALKWEMYSQNLGGFVEQVGRDSLRRFLLDDGDVMARYLHSDEHLLGRTSSGTVALTADDTGLMYDIAELPDTTSGRDLAVLLERGDVTGSSFAFYALDEAWGVTEDGFPLRTLLAIRLIDVAPVNSPAYLDTSAAVRSLAERIGADPEDIPALAERGEIVARLQTPTVIDLAPPVAAGATVAVRRLRMALDSRRLVH